MALLESCNKLANCNSRGVRTRTYLNNYKLFFDEGQTFDIRNIRRFKGNVGLYFIYNDEIQVRYPFSQSKLIYIGMSEKTTNSIAGRLQGHLEGTTGNDGISNYMKANDLYFTVLNFQMVKSIWPFRVELLESYYILDFVRLYGVYPICNNKSGYDVQNTESVPQLDINWTFFD